MAAHRFKPGESGWPAGKPKGAINKNSRVIKERYKDLIENNMDRIQEWIDDTARKDPHKAFEMLMKLSPFCVPKMTQEVGNTSPVFILPAGIDPNKIKGIQPDSGEDDDEDE